MNLFTSQTAEPEEKTEIVVTATPFFAETDTPPVQ